MTNLSLTHPGLMKLQRMQAMAKLCRVTSGFRSPRRFVLSVVALFLTVFWFGNTALAVFLREAAEPAAFQGMLAGSLTVYLGWHFLRAAFARPDAGILWTDVERQLLCGGPFTASELIRYRFSQIASAAFLKSILVAWLMRPDIHLWFPAAAGLFAALVFLDLLRMVVEIFASCCQHRTYLVFRTFVLTVVTALGLRVVIVALSRHVPDSDLSLPIGLRVAFYAYEELSLLRQSLLGTLATVGFRPFVHMIAAHSYTVALLGWTTLATALIAVSARMVLWMDDYFRRLQRSQEEFSYQVTRQSEPATRGSTGDSAEASINGSSDAVASRLRTWAGPIAWRQWLCVKKYAFSVAVALTPQLAMALLPLLGDLPPVPMLLNVAGTLAFFTLVLMPSALKVDFRRDLSLLRLYKAMPMSALSVVTGQLAVPVLVCTVFQATVLLVSVVVAHVPLGYAALALGMLLPVTIFVFAMENAIFLMYPHQPHQEGIEMFLRAILTFTVKGILFGLAMFVIIAWASAAGWIAAHCGWALSVTAVYTAGLCVMLTVVSTLAVFGLTWIYQRFDLSEDLPV